MQDLNIISYLEIFNKYFVWNSYFKDMAKKINKNYLNDNLSLTGPIKKVLTNNSSLNKIKKIMILDEVYEDRYSNDIIQELILDKNKIYYYEKPGKKL